MTSLFRSRRTGQGANAHHPVPAPRRKASRMLCWSLVAALAGGVGWGATHLHTTQSSALQGKPDTVAIAAASTAHDGIAAVDLEQIVAASDSVYALAANHQAVYEWSPDQNNWLKVRGATQKLYAGGDSVYAIATGSGDITKYSGEPGTGRASAAPVPPSPPPPNISTASAPTAPWSWSTAAGARRGRRSATAPRTSTPARTAPCTPPTRTPATSTSTTESGVPSAAPAPRSPSPTTTSTD